MKVNLLKKLREEAKERFKVKTYDGHLYIVEETLGFSHHKAITCTRDSSFELADMIKSLEKIRREYILSEVLYKRPKSPKIIKLNEKLSKL